MCLKVFELIRRLPKSFTEFALGLRLAAEERAAEERPSDVESGNGESPSAKWLRECLAEVAASDAAGKKKSDAAGN